MSGFVSQTGANYFGSHQSGFIDELNALPRFLCRDGDEHSPNNPPPLPRVAWYVRVQWMVRRTDPRRLAALASSLVLLIPAAAALVLAAAPAERPAINVIQVKSIDQAPPQISDPQPTTAEIEMRLGFGTKLSNPANEALPAIPGEQFAEATLPPADPNAPPDTPAMLILRNLPENVTFTTGESIGKGEWIMAAGDPNQLDMTLGEGFDQPVAADVELISHAGLSLGNLHLELRRNVAAVAEVQAAPPLSGPLSSAGRGAETEKSGPKDDAAPDANETESKPRKRVRRAITQTKQKFAQSDGGYIKRIKKIGRWKTKTLEAPREGDEQKTASVPADSPTDETSQGPIAKFFTWLKSDGNATAPAEPKVDTIENRAAMFPQ